MSKYTLHYFNTNGRAGIPRAILSYSKANWENNLISQEDWPKIKKSGLCEYEQLPVLEVNGKKYCESNAINLYLAETFNLMGKNAEENYHIYNLLMTFDDFLTKFKEYIICPDENKKAELKKNSVDKLQFIYQKFEEKYLLLGKNEYFLGHKFTLADIYVTVFLPTCLNLLGLKECPFEENIPNLLKLMKKVKENELKEYFEKYYTTELLKLK